MKLDRPGIFRARPKGWNLYVAKSTAVAANIEYVILAQLDVTSWIDWGGYDEHTIYANHWIIRKDGAVNESGVKALAEVLGWRGSVAEFLQPPPQIEVQITVREEEYNGATRMVVAWLNPVDYTPPSQSSDPDQLRQIDVQFGSLLRAAASAVTGKKPQPAAPKKQAPPPPWGRVGEQPQESNLSEPEPAFVEDDSDLPF